MVLGEGSCSAEIPCARSASPAAFAVRRVYASVVRNVGSCGACASASCRRASAASGACSSQRLRPLKADCAPKQRMPVRYSANPTSTAARLQPNIVSASRALPRAVFPQPPLGGRSAPAQYRLGEPCAAATVFQCHLCLKSAPGGTRHLRCRKAQALNLTGGERGGRKWPPETHGKSCSLTRCVARLSAHLGSHYITVLLFPEITWGAGHPRNVEVVLFLTLHVRPSVQGDPTLLGWVLLDITVHGLSSPLA